MTMKYKIRFLDYWHMGSGLSAGAKLDSSVIRDERGLPYVPGKTLKGLTREMAEMLGDKEFETECFGVKGSKMGVCRFGNASLPEGQAASIIAQDLKDYLYDEIASTKMKDGLAEDGSLREIEVVVPIELVGEIDDIPEKHMELLAQSLKMIRRMGLNRNRGLGRCIVETEALQ